MVRIKKIRKLVEMRHTKILVILILINLAPLASGCEEKMSAEKIATKIQENQARLEDYSGTINTTVYLNGEKNQEEVQVMYKKPNLIRASSLNSEKVEEVFDGKFIWSYDAGTNTVTKIKLPKKPFLTEKDYVKLIGTFLNESKISMLGVEEVGGRSAYVLEAEPKIKENEPHQFFRTKIWVDKKTWMALRCNIYDKKGNLMTEVEIRDLKINTGIPNSEFKFEVPARAEVKTVDLDKALKVSENMSLEEARQQASFRILIPDHIPEGYVLNSTIIYDTKDIDPESPDSQIAILSYKKGDENFYILETVYQSKSEDDMLMQEAEKININEKEGKYLNESGNLKMLQWELGQVEITLGGSLEKAEMLKIAESIPEPSTEFYILGPGGKADNYPTDYVLGENRTVIVGITNHEYKPTNYTMEVKLENISLPLAPEQKYISLGHNETWEKAITITPPFAGTNMMLAFSLYNEDKKDILERDIYLPYRDLHLLINVSQNVTGNTSIVAR